MENVKTRRPDRRVSRTRKAICNAFIELLLDHEISEIRIKEIADLADVNRKTIYNYYSSVYDILDEIENNLIVDYETVFNNLDFSCDYKNTYKVFEALNKLVAKDLGFYSRLLKMSSNNGLISKLVLYLKERVKAAFLEQHVMTDPNKVELATTYIVWGMISAYKYWFSSGQKVSLEDFSRDVYELVKGSLSSFVN